MEGGGVREGRGRGRVREGMERNSIVSLNPIDIKIRIKINA